MLYPARFSSVFPVSEVRIPVCGAALTAAMTVFIKPTVVYSNVLDLHMHPPLARSLTCPEQLPVLQTLFTVSALCRYTLFFFYTVILLYLFYIWVCLNTQILTLVLPTPTAFCTVTGCTGLWPRSSTTEPRCVLG